MNISSNEKVNNFIADIQLSSPEQFEILMSIRDIFFNLNEDLIEGIKYGGLVFNISNTLIAGIYIYKKHISIEFSNGADFIDVENVLDGGGKKRRHLKIFTNSDILQKNSEYFIKQAVNTSK